MQSKVQLVVALKEFSSPGLSFLTANRHNLLKGIVSRQKGANAIKDIPLIGAQVVEVDKNKADSFKKQMDKLGIIVNENTTYSIPTPIELLWPHDPRTEHIQDPKKRIDATHEVLQSLDPDWFNRGITGKEVTVCVIDTGLYPDKDELDLNNIVGFDDLVNGKSGVANLYDDDGHGTHVAGLGIANGSTAGGKFKGIAPDAKVYPIKVLNREGAGSLSDIISAIELAIKNKDKYGIRIISMSLGGPANLKEKDDLIALAVKKAYEAGIVPVIAAGNSGPFEYTIGSPGISSHAITVAAWDDKNTGDLKDDGITWWSSRGPTLRDQLSKPDIAGLGNQMVSLRSPGSYLDLENLPHLDQHHLLMSGTSMATPWTAFAIADVISANPDLTVPQVFDIVKNSGYKLNGESPLVQGAGLFNLPKACTLAQALKSNPSAA